MPIIVHSGHTATPCDLRTLALGTKNDRKTKGLDVFFVARECTVCKIGDEGDIRP